MQLILEKNSNLKHTSGQIIATADSFAEKCYPLFCHSKEIYMQDRFFTLKNVDQKKIFKSLYSKMIESNSVQRLKIAFDKERLSISESALADDIGIIKNEVKKAYNREIEVLHKAVNYKDFPRYISHPRMIYSIAGGYIFDKGFTVEDEKTLVHTHDANTFVEYKENYDQIFPRV